MPLVRIDIMEGRPPEKIRELHGRVAALVAEILDTPIERVRTYITQCPPEGWGIGGVPAVFNLMRQISLLYGPRGVTTHTLSPGPADTPRLRRIVATVAAERGAAEEEVWQEYGAPNSLGRLPTAEEVAWAAGGLLAPAADLLD